MSLNLCNTWLCAATATHPHLVGIFITKLPFARWIGRMAHGLWRKNNFSCHHFIFTSSTQALFAAQAVKYTILFSTTADPTCTRSNHQMLNIWIFNLRKMLNIMLLYSNVYRSHEPSLCLVSFGSNDICLQAAHTHNSKQTTLLRHPDYLFSCHEIYRLGNMCRKRQGECVVWRACCVKQDSL